jgi:hypothetical protein
VSGDTDPDTAARLRLRRAEIGMLRGDDQRSMDELHTLIATLEAQLAALKDYAGTDVTMVRDDVVKAKDLVESEIGSLVTKLRNL